MSKIKEYVKSFSVDAVVVDKAALFVLIFTALITIKEIGLMLIT